MHSNRYTLIFAMAITIVLAFFLSLADSSLKDKYEKNVEVDIRKNILLSLGFSPTDDLPWTNENVESIFQNSKFVKKIWNVFLQKQSLWK